MVLFFIFFLVDFSDISLIHFRSGDSVNVAKHLLHFYIISEDLRTLCGCCNHSADI